MIWVDREVKKIRDLNLKQLWIDDMKTPSGRVHVGALRGVIVHDLLYKAFSEKDDDVHFSYVFNNMDPMDAIPSYLEYDKWEQYAGMPLYKIPSPEPGAANFADFYAKEFIKVFESINCHPQIIWSSELYESGKMNDVIKLALDNAVIIRKQYEDIAKAPKPDNWYPFQVICEKCGKVGTTSVTEWDGKEVTYTCKVEMVAWAEGCGNSGRISPFNGTGKLLWKVDWPAHWKVIGVTVEGSGKDHMSAGGSYDLSSGIAKHALEYQPPYAPAYEWFTIGGSKMSSSKGIGTSAKESSEILPADILRFLLVRTPIERSIDFNPFGDTIPNLFDDYDRCMNAHFDKLENKIPTGKPGEVLLDFARIIELSEVRPLPEQRVFLPRFRTIINLLKTKTDILAFFTNQKGSALTDYERELLEERIVYAEVYLKSYAEEGAKLELVEKSQTGIALSRNQKQFLKLLIEKLEADTKLSRDEVQTMIFGILKENNLQAKEVFSAFYQILIGKEFGPKATDLILEFGKDAVLERLKSHVGAKSSKAKKEERQYLFPKLTDTKVFSIHDDVKEKFPSIIIGVATMRNLSIQPSEELQEEIGTFIRENQNLTNEIISSYPEVLSYRKLYKEMGIDWHSKRPSPEALLRRVALKKELRSINSVVDAYNLVVMRNRVSVGAFDLDAIKFPTEFRFPKQGEHILLIGDTEPTNYTEDELAYFDQVGGYNIDFNFRDAQRTAVTEKTKNILINVDGVYGITREQVEKSMKEVIEIIQKYCGGTVGLAGIVTAS